MKSLTKSIYMRKVENTVEEKELPSWRELLGSRGVQLWSFRRQAFAATQEKSQAKLVIVPVDHNEKLSWIQRMMGRKATRIAVLSCPHLFYKVEQEQDDLLAQKSSSSHHGNDKDYHGFDKPDTRGRSPRPLTQCTHEEWVRMRPQVLHAFCNLPQRSLRAVRRVPLDAILHKCTMKTKFFGDGPTIYIDWKEVAVSVAAEWVVQLFRGDQDTIMVEYLHKFWKASRSLEFVPKESMQQARYNLTSCLISSTAKGDYAKADMGVLDSLFQSGLSTEEAKDNAINAMVAAMDAAQALLFWTMWNLSQSKDHWEKAQSTMRTLKEQPDLFESDLIELASFKKAATQGELVDCSQLSFLGRALCETVRVFPPVWTLPRTWPRQSQVVPICPQAKIQWSKLDVAAANGAFHPQEDWNPDTPQPHHVASFGLGRRHCPAGTAALHAVYWCLHEFLHRFESFQEDVPNHALDSTFLLPTLSVVGPQYFRIKLRVQPSHS